MGKKDEKAFNNAKGGQSADASDLQEVFTGENPAPKGDEDIPLDKLAPGEVPKDKGNFRKMTGQGD